jgi:TetR/AcrR family transcriptional regulator, transcriptional repressor for nem operon
MRLTKEQATEHRQRIIETAGRLFRESGFNGVSVADLMNAAGFTHGGFYNHFPSKEALAAEAALAGLQRSNAALTETLMDQDQAGSDHSALWPYIEAYLSSAHRDNRADGCTIASLASDAARQDEQVQASFAQGIDEELDILASYFAKTPAQDQEDMPASARERAVQLLSELVGAIMLARAVAQANLSLSDEILAAASTGLQTQMKQTTTLNQ